MAKKVILRNGEVRFRARWNDKGPDGARKQREQYFETEKAAKTHETMMADRVGRLGVSDGDKTLVSTWMDKWIAGRVERGELSPTTYPSEFYNLEKFKPLIGHLTVAQLTPGDIEDALTALLKRGGRGGKPLKASSVSIARAILHNCLESARKRKLRVDNPVKDAESPKQPMRRVPKPWTADEAQRLIAAAAAALNDALIVIVLLLAGSGFRRCEVLGLRWPDVDWKTGKISANATVVPDKTGAPVFREVLKTQSSQRTITVPEQVLAELRRHKTEQAKHMLRLGEEYHRLGLIFPDVDGQPMRPMRMTDLLRNLMTAAGIAKGKQPAHAWRHLHLSTLLKAKQDIVTVSQRAGHSRVTTTLNFYGSTDSEQDAAASDIIGNVLTALSRPVADGNK